MSQQQNQTQNPMAPSASDAHERSPGAAARPGDRAMIAKNLNIAPTLEIRPGYRFNVIVTKDMTFSKPYQSFDY
jgi:type IV secretory pathway VirB10-like protein